MVKNSENIYYHIGYWIFVILILIFAFGFSWGNKAVAFYFVCMLLPIVLGTSYFFNYVLVPKFFFTKRYARFAFYTFCTAVFSLYLEMLVLVFSFVYLLNYNFQNLSTTASDTKLLAAVLYLLVSVGSFILMMNQIREHQQMIKQLVQENEKMKKSFLEIMSNRKLTKIPFEDIVYIESLADYIKVVTVKDVIMSKEKISKLASRLPEMFLRIHRSFIINTDRVKEHALNEVLVDDVRLNIGRSYRTEVKEILNSNSPAHSNL